MTLLWTEAMEVASSLTGAWSTTVPSLKLSARIASGCSRVAAGDAANRACATSASPEVLASAATVVLALTDVGAGYLRTVKGRRCRSGSERGLGAAAALAAAFSGACCACVVHLLWCAKDGHVCGPELVGALANPWPAARIGDCGKYVLVRGLIRPVRGVKEVTDMLRRSWDVLVGLWWMLVAHGLDCGTL